MAERKARFAVYQDLEYGWVAELVEKKIVSCKWIKTEKGTDTYLIGRYGTNKSSLLKAYKASQKKV